MNSSGKMPTLTIGELEAKIPIIQGGMGVGVSLYRLASSVANEGGIGVIASAGIGVDEPDYSTNFREANRRSLRNQIRKTRKLTDGLIGVNIMLALSDHEELSMIAMEENVDLIFLGAGLPLKLPKSISPDRMQEIHTRVVPIVSSGKAAKIIFRSWAKRYNHVPDAIVVEGPMAGGHLGFKKEQIKNPDFQLEKILPDVVAAIEPYEQQFGKSIPIIAAGGIYTGEDIYNCL
ncbi:nitronate monooxygenase, partial [bacterium]|nr:nitronate monooxygenase [bacterium]